MGHTIAIAKILKKLRTDKRISQEVLSSRAQLNRTYVSLLERHKRSPSMNTLAKICKVLETSPSYFMQLVEDEVNASDDKQRTYELNLFRSIAESSCLAISITDANGNITYVNNANEELFGINKKKAMKRNFRDYFPSSSTELIENEIWPQIKMNKIWSGELSTTKANGTTFKIWNDFHPLCDNNGDLIYTFSIMHDITKQKENEENIIKSKQLLDLFFKQSLDGIYFMNLDSPINWEQEKNKNKLIDSCLESQRVIKANQAILDIHNTTEDKFINSPPIKIFKSNISQMKDFFHELYQKGRITKEYKISKNNGEDLHIEGDYICIKNQQGLLMGHFGIERDISPRKNLEKALTESKETLKTLLNATADMIFVFDKHGRYHDVKTSDQYNFLNKSEISGKKFSDIFPTEIAKLFLDHTKDVISNKQENSLEYRLPVNGKWRWYKSSSYPVETSSNECSFAICIIKDITDQKQIDATAYETESKLFHTCKSTSLTTLSAGILGDIESPIENLKTTMNSLKSQLAPEQQFLLDSLNQNISNLENTRDELEKISNIGIEEPPLWFNAKALISNVTDYFKKRLKSHNIRFDITQINGQTQIYGKQGELAKMLFNIIENSFYAITQVSDKWIKIEIETSNTESSITITNSANGFTEVSANNILTRKCAMKDYDHSNPTIRLHLSKKIIEEHGGTLTLDLKSKTSKFIATLPNEYL